MNTERTYGNAEAVDEFSNWAVGLGIVIVALFPLSLPFLILTAVALVPFVLPLVAVGLIGAVMVLPVLLVRRMVRGWGRAAWRAVAPKGS